MLIRLIQARFDGDAGLRGRLSIAVLAGIPLHVPVGAAIGGEFSQTPICTEALQRGCVVSFASFADGADPKDDSRIPTPAGQERVCVNPAALDRPCDHVTPYWRRVVETGQRKRPDTHGRRRSPHRARQTVQSRQTHHFN